jgi:hypothetical protein
MNKIVTTASVKFPYKWIEINTYEDIQGLPKWESIGCIEPEQNKTVPCLCIFTRNSLMRNGKFEHESKLQYPPAPYPLSYTYSEKIGTFLYDFDIFEWCDVHSPNLRLPSWAVYYVLPLSTHSTPDGSKHPARIAPSKRIHQFPRSTRCAKAMQEIEDVQKQLENTVNDPNLILTTAPHFTLEATEDNSIDNSSFSFTITVNTEQ